MDKLERQRILADLCTEELNNLKWKGVNNVQLSPAKMYALNHGACHTSFMQCIGVKIEALELERRAKSHIVDLEIVYAKNCINSTVMVEDLLLGFQSRGLHWIITGLPKYFDILLFLLRKHHHQLTFYPETFLQTMLLERGKVLSPQESNLLQHKYPEIPYMEDVHNRVQLEVFQPDLNALLMWSVWTSLSSWTIWCVNVQKVCSNCGHFLVAGWCGHVQSLQRRVTTWTVCSRHGAKFHQ